MKHVRQFFIGKMCALTSNKNVRFSKKNVYFQNGAFCCCGFPFGKLIFLISSSRKLQKIIENVDVFVDFLRLN